MENDLNIEKNYARFVQVLKQYITRDGIDAFLEWLQSTDAAVCPCSTKYHLCEEGGFIQHSLNVLNRLARLNKAEYGDNSPYSRETLVFVSLLHDISKVNYYEKLYRNVKDEETGNWEKKPYFSIRKDSDRIVYGTPSETSLYILRKFFTMSYDEEMAILYHMGELEDEDRRRDYYTAYRKSPLALLLHTADIMAMTLDEPCGQ